MGWYWGVLTFLAGGTLIGCGVYVLGMGQERVIANPTTADKAFIALEIVTIMLVAVAIGVQTPWLTQLAGLCTAAYVVAGLYRYATSEQRSADVLRST